MSQVIYPAVLTVNGDCVQVVLDKGDEATYYHVQDKRRSGVVHADQVTCIPQHVPAIQEDELTPRLIAEILAHDPKYTPAKCVRDINTGLAAKYLLYYRNQYNVALKHLKPTKKASAERKMVALKGVNILPT